MGRIVLRQEKLIVILMKRVADSRSSEILHLKERGIGSGDPLGERFHARTHFFVAFFSAFSEIRGVVGRAGLEFCQEEVDFFTAQKFRDNAEAPVYRAKRRLP